MTDNWAWTTPRCIAGTLRTITGSAFLAGSTVTAQSRASRNRVTCRAVHDRRCGPALVVVRRALAGCAAPDAVCITRIPADAPGRPVTATPASATERASPAPERLLCATTSWLAVVLSPTSTKHKEGTTP